MRCIVGKLTWTNAIYSSVITSITVTEAEADRRPHHSWEMIQSQGISRLCQRTIPSCGHLKTAVSRSLIHPQVLQVLQLLLHRVPSIAVLRRMARIAFFIQCLPQGSWSWSVGRDLGDSGGPRASNVPRPSDPSVPSLGMGDAKLLPMPLLLLRVADATEAARLSSSVARSAFHAASLAFVDILSVGWITSLVKPCTQRSFFFHMSITWSVFNPDQLSPLLTITIFVYLLLLHSPVF